MTTAKRFIALRKHYGQFEIYSQPINPKTGKAWQADTLKDVFDNAGKALVAYNRMKKANTDATTEFRGYQQDRRA